MHISAHFLPLLTTPEEMAGAAAVVIDVLRASTTITHALAAGCREVIPCLEVDDARQAAASFPPGEAVLGGERGGLPIAGFALGNSPDECCGDSVGGKTLVFTTTNGTRAMLACRQARRVLIGAFVNLSAVCRALRGESNVHLLCAGTRGQVTREDVLCAGAIADRVSRDAQDVELNDQAAIARDAWRAAIGGAHANSLKDRLTEALRATQGGRNLRAIGLERDIVLAADLDRFDVVGELDVEAWRIGAR